jgi:hypothetical protein
VPRTIPIVLFALSTAWACLPTAAAAARQTPPEAPLPLYWSDGGLRTAAAYVEALQAAETAAFLEEATAFFASLPTPTTTPTRAYSSSAPVSGDCYGSDLPDYIISRESGGDPNARNPSGAWGCAQFMPGTWNGTCSDLGDHGSASVEAQNECANRLWAGGSGSSHWAATR